MIFYVLYHLLVPLLNTKKPLSNAPDWIFWQALLLSLFPLINFLIGVFGYRLSDILCFFFTSSLNFFYQQLMPPLPVRSRFGHLHLKVLNNNVFFVEDSQSRMGKLFARSWHCSQNWRQQSTLITFSQTNLHHKIMCHIGCFCHSWPLSIDLPCPEPAISQNLPHLYGTAVRVHLPK